jgi:hypothetical protein
VSISPLFTAVFRLSKVILPGISGSPLMIPVAG